MNFRRRKAQTRKKLVATVNRCEDVYSRAGEPNVTSGGKEEQRRERALTYKISRSKRYKTCSDVEGTVKIWAIEMSDRSSDRRR